MRLVACLQDECLFPILQKAGIEDVILAPKELARLGKHSWKETNRLALFGKKRNFRPILLWDTLMRQKDFKKSVDCLKSLSLKNFYAIRLQDPGAFYFIKKNFPRLKIQLILERGNHNMDSLQSWCKVGGENLDRLILPLEFDRNILVRLLKNLSVSVELLGLGRILLYHSPRKLLSDEFQEHNDGFLQVMGSSEETPHKGFSFLENQHGTFMFYPKDYCLLEHLEELKQMGVEFLRLDISAKNHHQYFCIADLLQNFSEQSVLLIKKKYEKEVVGGFFRANRSDSLFLKLKNPHIRPSANFLGEVVEVKKENYLALLLKNKRHFLKKGDTLLFKTPDGKKKQVIASGLKDSSGREISQAFAEDLVLMAPIGGISVKTAVFLAEEQS